MRQTDSKNPEGFLERRAHAIRIKKENDLLKPWEERIERGVDEWLQKLFFGASRPEILKELSECSGTQEEYVPSAGLQEEAERLRSSRAELLDFLNRITDFLLEAFGEDLELSDWLHGIKNHGDFQDLGFTRPELSRLMEQREQEEKLRRNIAQMEELYETADCI